ncbi:hypothetical protein IHQ68_14890 [Chelatococcus sambhunathii]|uniref:Uncharacterized protein n=1 Tax=Chelatococcus sambhunathii TaxID=363953 RepID=A0ABU1DIH2_9HYPH|nr:DUF6600 domain-containing protein [Chelatococcus sambhunathii]MDR4307906.1 hypothetical protein [Chelatococcus sambhunathii]
MNPISWNQNIRTSFRTAALAFGLAAAPLAFAGAVFVAPGVAHAQTAPTLEAMKQTLGQYGEFVTHEKYGDVWRPTVTPRGWHPYPACDWVFTKTYGWYFSDKTPWGAIVHHYGRWIHEADRGWLWVPGAEFSPGWVVWRTSDEWVGWAPTPPDAELTPAKMEAFNDDKLWTFMDAKKFGSTCGGGPTVAQYGDLYASTAFVTDIRFVGGVAVFVLPPKIKGPEVNIDIDVFAPWNPTFIGTWINNWTNIFNDVDINVVINQCTPKDPQDPKYPQNPNDPRDPRDPVNPKPRMKQFGDNPPPAPGLKGPGGLQPRQPDRVRLDGGRDPGRRTVKTFEPQPDDVVVHDRLPGRQPLKLRDPGRGRGDVQADPGLGRQPFVKFRRDAGPVRRDPGVSHRQPGDFGRSAQDFGGRGLRGQREAAQRFDGGPARFEGGPRSFRGGFRDRN